MKETRCVYNQNICNTNNNNIRIYELYMYIIHICLFNKVIRTIIKIKPDHFIFIDTEDHRQEINLTAPVSYSIKKIY